MGNLILTAYTLKDPIIMAPKGSSKVLKSFSESVPGNTNVAIASAVTAYSRMIINEYKLIALNKKLQIYYSDTDSLVLNGPLPSEYLDSATLGKLKLEHTFREGIFVMPKVYYLELEDGGVITKCKGYSGKLTKEQYLTLLNGEALELVVDRWFRSLKDSRVQIKRNESYKLAFLFNKRKQIIKDGVWTNTSPIILTK